jgi:Ran GTPase-activating protein (RanGAP) involved in mRNA processing and transport
MYVCLFGSSLLLLYVRRSVSFNGIESEGAKFISQALLLNTSVEVLLMDSNYIQDEGLTYLCKALEVHDQLRDLR